MSTPPPILLRIFRAFCRRDLHLFIEGDLIELYEERVRSGGQRWASIRLATDILLLFRPSIIKPVTNVKLINNNTMVTNYFKIAIRNLMRKKVYSAINIAGLAIGIACCILIFQYVSFEYSFDTFHANKDNIYRMNVTGISPDCETSVGGNTGWAPGPTMKAEVPEMNSYVRLHPEYDYAIVSNPDEPELAFEETDVFYTDTSFFNIFSFPLLYGESSQMLRPGTAVLSESMAKKYFGDEEAIGKTLDVRGWIDGSYIITGIAKDVRPNSHLRFDMLLPMADLLEKSDFKDPATGWGWSNFLTYVSLRPDAHIDAVNDKLTEIYLENRAEDFAPTGRSGALTLMPLADIHFGSDIPAPYTTTANKTSVYFFALVGLITLCIAFINYINITTARALDRAREVGVRKVVGAGRIQLIFQFLTESAFTIFISFLLAILTAFAVSPLISEWTSIPLSTILWSDYTFWLVFGIILILFTLIAGIYPAMILSSFQPTSVLKGLSRQTGASAWLRQGLVIFQFSISIALLAGTLVVRNQMEYLRNMDLGLELDQIVTVLGPRVLPEDVSSRNAYETLQNEISNSPGVIKTASSHSLPGKEHSFTTSNIRKIEDDRTFETVGSVTFVDSAFIQLYGFELLSGDGFRNISLPLPEDASIPVLINEAAVSSLGYSSSQEALNREIYLGGNQCIIKGVLKNFNWYSAHAAIEPTFFWLGSNQHYISAAVSAASLPETLDAIEERFNELFPGNPFVYSFADERFETQYRNDQRFSRLFNMFAGLAIFIACLGLFGLATHTARQRQKEVGIRKVMGANISSIIILLSRDFMRLVLIGFILAVPIAWYVMRGWLEDFAFKIDISPVAFLFAGIAAIIISMLTVCWQSLYAALVNPAESLRDE